MRCAEPLSCYRQLGDRRLEGDTLASLSNILWCPGRGVEARKTGLEAVALLQRLPPGRELASAYSNLSFLFLMEGDTEAARVWCGRALELAERLDEPGVLSAALLRLGGFEEDYRLLERGLALAEQSGLEEQVGDAYLCLAATAAYRRSHEAAESYVERGLAYCNERGLTLLHLYLLAQRAHIELETGRWTEAAETAKLVLAERAISTFPRTAALVVLALVRARRGDPDVLPLLDRAGALADPTGELPRIGPVALARAETAWLQGDYPSVASATEGALAPRREIPVGSGTR